MKKSKRIALGGWLNNILSIATRGWFGAAAIPPEPLCVEIDDTTLHDVALGDAPVYALDLSDMAVYSVALTDNAVYSVVLGDVAVYSVAVSDEVCDG